MNYSFKFIYNITLCICLQTRIDRLQGADPTSLENKVRHYYGSDESCEDDNTVAGHVSNTLFKIQIILDTI